MAEYNMTDKEQVEMLKEWWNNYGKAIAIAIAVGLIVAFGWRYWHSHNVTKTQTASGLYEQLVILDSKKNVKAADVVANKLITEFKKTPYATMAALRMIRERVNQKDYKNALEQTEWVIKNGNAARFRQVARIRAARIQLFLNEPQAALATLAKVEDKTFQPLIDEVKGDIYTAMKKPDLASKFYKNAKAGLTAEGITNPILNMKLAQP